MNRVQLSLCASTISPSTFYLIVADALESKKRLSVVRMGDGEASLMKACERTAPTELLPATWGEGLGLKGITHGMVRARLQRAAEACTYFAPSITGILREAFDVYRFFPHRDHYVDNFFVNVWDEQQKIELFKKAGHVLFIHRNAQTADSMQLRAQGNIGVKVSWLKLSDWTQTDDVIAKATENNAPLVLFSAGPAGKYIGPEIVRRGKIAKVALDLGNTADKWTLSSLPIDRKAAEEFHKQWTKGKK